MSSSPSTGQRDDLSRRLKSRHIMMIALGGAIGAGMFKGSSTSISLAGPSVMFAYLIGGIILLFVMRGLAEMTMNSPRAKTFRDLVEPVLGRFTGHLIGWMYWLDWVLVMAAETATAASFLGYWFPTAQPWVLALIVSVAITLVNLFQVNVYGETEYWLAGFKIAVLILFILFGGTLLFTGYAHHPAPGFSNITGHGGLFPHGLNGLMQAMLVVMFSFGGTEMVGMTIGETESPETTIPKAARGVIFRTLLFYILPIIVIISMVPWDQLSQSESPFVTVFESMGIPFVGELMNFVMLTAVLSATNTGMYAASRMLYSQAQDGEAPRFFAHLSRRKVPTRALLASTLFLYIGVIIAFFAGGNTFNYLMVIPGYSVLIVWLILAIAHIRSRVIRSKSDGTSGFPWTSLIAVILLSIVFVGIVITSPITGTGVTLFAVVLIVLSYFIAAKRTASK